jgi:hypothetical protein
MRAYNMYILTFYPHPLPENKCDLPKTTFEECAGSRQQDGSKWRKDG